MFGITQAGSKLDSGDAIYYYAYSTGRAYKGTGTGLTLTSGGHENGAVYGFALDMTTRTLSVTHNGQPAFSTTLTAGMTSVTPGVGENWYLSPHVITANFGQSSFKYPVPAGYNKGLW